MNSRQQKSLLSFLSTVFVLALVCLVTSTSFAWESQDPQLAEDFAKMLGFKAKDKVGTAAPDIKPGMAIDSSNYQQYPGLKEILPESLYNRLDPQSYAPLAPVKIKETDQYHLGRGWMKKTQESAKTLRIADDGITLEGYVGGYPFVNPQNGVELVQWADNPYLGDTFFASPMRLRLFGKQNTPEREMRQNGAVIRFSYCTDWRPEGIEPNPDKINYVVAGVFTYPRDISGTSYVRKRFIPADKTDEFLLYIASMRRIRKMSGRDTQDPLFGSDLLWDDYNMFWQKLSSTEFPNDYNMLPAREMLIPTFIDYQFPENRETAGYTDYNVDESGGQVFLNFGSWQRRWVYMLEITSKDRAYVYGKRIIANEPEACVQVQADFYDQTGRLWRSWIRDYNLTEDGVGTMEDLIDIVDHINQHRTILDWSGTKNARWVGPDYADLRFLSRKAK